MRKISEGFLTKEPVAGAGKHNVTRGSLIVFMACIGLGFASLVPRFNLFWLLAGLLVGVSILLSGVGDLVFEREREFAVRIRSLSIVAVVLSWVSLVSAIVRDWEFFGSLFA